MRHLIEMKQISKSFPGVKALDKVDFTVAPGEVHALIGENGAGKSTLIKIICGVNDFEGEFLLDGESVRFTSPSEAINRGIRVIYQELNLCETITVAENIYMGRLPYKYGGLVVDRKKLHSDAGKYLHDIGLEISPKVELERLPTSKKQMVEIAKAISAHAKLIIMDEPTSSLGDREINRLFAIIEQLKRRGISVIYVSHKLEEIFRVADRVTVLRDGELIGTHDVNSVNQDQLIHMMVGREFTSLYIRSRHERGNVALRVEHITTPKLRDISFKAHAGEIIGFSGLIGAGRTELAKAIFGFDERESGDVFINERKVPSHKTHVAKKLGMGYVSEDRKKEGLFSDLTIKENISITILQDILNGPLINTKKEMERVREISDKIRIKTPTMAANPAKLSGGNQQKVIVARWLVGKDIRVLIVDEPTRGIDVGAKVEIYSILDGLAKSGMLIVIMSSEMNEILSICDRIYVMSDGRITAEYSKEEATSELLMEKSIG